MDIMLHLTFVPWLIIIPFHIDSNGVISVCNIKFVWHSNSFMQMASSEHTACRIPFKDISNTNNESGPTTSNLQPDDTDPKERKRQRARDACKHASRSKGEVTKKMSRRLSSKESSSSPYKWRFTTHNPTPCWRLLDFLSHIMSTGILSNVEQCDTSRVENMVPYENADWLHRNDSYNMPHATKTSLQVLGTAYNCPVNIILYICYFIKWICYICCNTIEFHFYKSCISIQLNWHLYNYAKLIGSNLYWYTLKHAWFI